MSLQAKRKEEIGEICLSGGCFACVNSGKGFISYFDEILDSAEFVYVIKGGPGTGKSGLAAHIAAAAEARGEKVQRIYCSSDPASLDGLMLTERKIALVDGTAPHARDLKTPGVDSFFLDTGRFLDVPELRRREDEIDELNRKKSAAFARGYLLLSAAENVSEALGTLTRPLIDVHMTVRLIDKHLPRPMRVQRPAKVLPLVSVGMKGVARLDTAIAEASYILTLTPCFGVELLLLEEMRREADRRGLGYSCSPDPCTLCPDSLYFPQSGLLVRGGTPLGKENEKVFSPRRLLTGGDKESRARIRTLYKESQGLFERAKEAFISAAPHHFALEKIYGEAMDFSGVDEMKEETVRRIFQS